MKKITVIILALSVLTVSCSKKEKGAVEEVKSGIYSGMVVETMDVEGYTYIKMDRDGNEIWIAGPRTKAEKGRRVYYTDPMEMKNFHSRALDRDFETILFVNNMYFDEDPMKSTESESRGHAAIMDGHQDLEGSQKTLSLQKAEGGYSIAVLYKNAEDLQGQTVIVRGEVQKVSLNIMGRNWVHLQDGTNFDGSYDLTFTTSETFEKGETVTVTGVLKKDVDLGFGYFYTILLEETVRK